MLSEDFIQTLLLTFKLSFFTTLILAVIGIPIAYFLAYKEFPLKPMVEAVVSLPIVLPPTVLGYYLLILLSQDNPVGRFLGAVFGEPILFTFKAILIGSVIYSLPFMVQPVQAGFESLPKSLIEASYTLGKSRLTTFLKVILPNVKPSILTGIVLSFAHTVGEFGVVLMIGGSIPGETKVASISIYEEVEALNYENANLYALILLGVSMVILATVYWLNKRFSRLG
ncbi:MAG: molybdate ABC transporter permease subunit [Aquificae bacterium]|nr:molybdate ABC transporter permease subunit [Aquificota bacterium]